MVDPSTTTGTTPGPNLERQFLSALTEHSNGDPSAAQSAYLLLMDAARRECVTADLTYLLIAALKLSDDNVPVAACCALASSEVKDPRAINALIQTALHGSPRTAPAAVAALGRFPSEQAVDSIISVVEQYTGSDEHLLTVSFNSLGNHIEVVAGVMDRLEAAFGRLVRYQQDVCSQRMDSIRQQVRGFHAEQISSLDLPDCVPVKRVLMGSTVSSKYPERDSLVVKADDVISGSARLPAGRFRFRLKGAGQIGLTIVPLGERNLLLFSEDSDSYVHDGKLRGRVGKLVSTLCKLYDLDPTTTAVGYHLAPTSGLTDDQRDEYRLVVFRKTDLQSGIVSQPSVRGISSLPQLLNEAQSG